MSYMSVNTFPASTPISTVKNLIDLLGYKKVSDKLSTPNQLGAYFWFASFPDISFVGVELYLYKHKDIISVETRTTISRSYWDLKHQNKTIKYLHDYLGGYFETDEGKNRYLRRDEKEPSRLASGLFLSRWIFHNALAKPFIYLNCRELRGNVANDNPTGLDMLDEINPRFFSNIITIPYILGAWEEYLRASFTTILQYTDFNPKVYKAMRLHPDDLQAAFNNTKRLEYIMTSSLSFQRPSVIDANFKSINSKLDIAGVLNKPYKGRKITLFKSIDQIVEERNLLVHTGINTMKITDQQIKKIIVDFEVSADRIYDLFGDVYNFTPDKKF